MSTVETKVGDAIAIAGPGHSSTSPNRRGEVLDVWGEPGRELFRVRWSDGTVTVVPSSAVGAWGRPRLAPIPRGAGRPASRRGLSAP